MFGQSGWRRDVCCTLFQVAVSQATISCGCMLISALPVTSAGRRR